jgi:RHS repeat-associated protein
MVAWLVGLVLGVSTVGLEVFPAQAVEPWQGLLDVTVDDPVLDAFKTSTTVRVVPSVKVDSPHVLSLYDTSTGKLVGSCSGSSSAACRTAWNVSVTVPLDSQRVFRVFVATDSPSSQYPAQDVSAEAQVSVRNVGWTGSLEVSVDRPVVDAFDGSTVVTVTPSIKVVEPYVVSLYDDSTGSLVSYCEPRYSHCPGTGDWRAWVSVPLDQSKTFTAYVAQDHPDAGPPISDVKASASVSVVNEGWLGSVSVSVDRPVVDALDRSARVTVSPSIRLVAPYVMALYDDSTGRLVSYCEARYSGCVSGAWSVGVQVPLDASTTFTAYVAQDHPSAGPPVVDVKASASVGVVNEGWVGSLSMSVGRPAVEQLNNTVTVAVTPSIPVAWPYVMTLYDDSTGRQVGWCRPVGWSPPCPSGPWSVDVQVPSDVSTTFTAYVAQDYPSTGAPGLDVKAAASVVSDSQLGLLSVSVDRPVVDAVNPSARVRVSSSIRSAPYVLSLYDDSTGRLVSRCAAGSSLCGPAGWSLPVNVALDASTTFTAYVAQDYPSEGPPVVDVRASGSVQVVNEGWLGSVAVSVDHPVVDALSNLVRVSVEPSIRLVAPYRLSLYDDSTGRLVGSCAPPSLSCSSGGWYVQLNVGIDGSTTFTGYVAQDAPAAGPPVVDVKASASVGVVNEGWLGSVSVSVKRPVVDALNNYTSVIVSPSIRLVAPYVLSLYDDSTGQLVSYCGPPSSSCTTVPWSVGVSVPLDMSKTFTAYVARDRPAEAPPVVDVKGSASVSVVNEGWLGSLEAWTDRSLVDASDPQVIIHSKTSLRLVEPYVLSIYDSDTGRRVSYCRSGYAACLDVWRVSVRVTNEASERFDVYVADTYPELGPPVGDVKASRTVQAANRGWLGSLEASVDRPVVDSSDPHATVTVVPSVKIGSPYVMSLYDDSGTRLAYCLEVSFCRAELTVKVAPGAGQSRVYTAYVAQDYPPSGRPAKDVRTAASVTVTHAGWTGTLSLTSPEPELPVGTAAAGVTVRPSQNVPEPYVTSVYDDTGKRLWMCQATDCRADGGSFEASLAPGRLAVLYGFVALTAPDGMPPVDGVAARAELAVSRDAWDGTVEATAEPLDLDAVRSSSGYRTRIEVVFAPPLPLGVDAALYDDSGTRVAWMAGNTEGLESWDPVVASPDQDRVYTVVVADDLPAGGLPDKRWGLSAVVVPGGREHWQGEVKLTATAAGTPGSWRLTGRFSEPLDAGSSYGAQLVDDAGRVVGACGLSASDPVCGEAWTSLVAVPAHEVWSLRVRVGAEEAMAGPPGGLVWSDPVDAAGVAWSGSVSFHAAGSVDPATSKVVLAAAATPAIPAQDRIVLFGHGGAAAEVCEASVCSFAPVVPASGAVALFTAGVVRPAWDGEGLASAEAAGLLIASRTVEVWPGSGGLAVTADTGLRGVVDSSDPVVRVTASVALPLAQGQALVACDQDRQMAYGRAAGGTTWTDASFAWTVPPEIVGTLTVAVVPSPASCDDLGQATASQELTVEHVGYGGEVLLAGSQPSAHEAYSRMDVLLSRPIGAGYTLEVTDLTSGQLLLSCPATAAWHVCATRLTATVGVRVAPLTTSSFRADVRRIDSPDGSRMVSSDVFAATHPGWTGTASLAFGAVFTANNEYVPGAITLSEPIGDAQLWLCSDYGWNRRDAARSSCSPVSNRNNPYQSVFAVGQSAGGYEKTSSFEAFVVYGPDTKPAWGWEGFDVQERSGRAIIRDRGWEGALELTAEVLWDRCVLPLGNQAWGGGVNSGPARPGDDCVRAMSLRMRTTPGVGDQGYWAMYKRQVYSSYGLLWYCRPGSALNCAYWSSTDWRQDVSAWDQNGGASYYRAAVCVNNTENGPADGPCLVTSAWAGPTEEEAELLESICGANPSVDDSVACHGDPVSSASGEWWETAEDLVMDGAGPGLQWARSFSTFDRDAVGALGKGWRSNLEMRLEKAPAVAGSSDVTLQEAAKIRVIQENGSVVDFTRGTDGRYGSPARVRADLERNPDGGFVMTRRDAQRFNFDPAGRLVSLADEHGNTVTVDYDAQGALTGVHDDHGRHIRLAYTGGRVTGVADQAGRSVAYTYDSAGRLTRATGWDGTATTYSYDSEGRVTRIAQPTGGTFTNVYDDFDRVVSQKDPAGGVTGFEYDDEGGTTIITGPDGVKTKEEYADHLLVKVTEAFGTDQATSITYGYQAFVPSQVTSETDDLGNRTAYTYDQDGHLLTVTDPMGVKTQAFYDQDGHLSKTTDAGGASTLSTFDQSGNLASVTDAAGNVTTLTSNPDGTVASVTAPDGGATVVGYNQWGYPVSETSPEGVASTVVTDSVGRVVSETDGAGLATAYGYDGRGFLTSATGPDGLATRYGYHASGLLASVTDPLGSATRYVYDSSGRVAEVTDSTGARVVYERDRAGRVVRETATGQGGLRAVTSYGYDLLGRLVSVTDPTGQVSRFGYDRAGNLAWAQSASGSRTGYVYDRAGRVLVETSPSGSATSYSWDGAGRLVSAVDGDGRYQNLVYSETGSLARRVAGRQGTGRVAVESWTYDASGRLVGHRDPDGLVEAAAHDLDGRVVSESAPASGATGYAYDQAGRLASATTADSAVAAYSYDASGRLASVAHSDPGTADVAYAYDRWSRLAGVSDGASYSYDRFGRVTRASAPAGSVGYAYDGFGRLASVGYPDGRKAAYVYDAASRLTRVVGPGGEAYSYGYDPDGRVASLTYPNGAVTSYAYDADSQVAGISTLGPDGATVLDLGYAYTAAGLMDTQTAGRGSDEPASSAYSWDAQARLAGVALPDPTGGAGVVSAVSSTLGGSLTGLDTGVSLAYEAATGRLASATTAQGATTTFAHDLVGSRASETVGGALARAFRWDQAGDLTGVAGADGPSVAYTYDAAGLLRTREETAADGQEAASEGFVWDTSRPVPVMLTDGESWFVYGLGSAPLAQHPVGDGGGAAAGSAASSSLFLHGDLTGSVRAVTDPGGRAVAGSDWTAYGKPLQAAGSAPVSSVTRFGYAGEWADPATGLVYLRARWLDPATGSFLSVDPANGATGDAYGYASGNPVQLTDPSGLFTVLGWDAGAFLGDAGRVVEAQAKRANNFLYGAADSLLMGVPSMVADEMGWANEWFDSCSSAFEAGGWAEMAAEVVVSVVFTGGTTTALVIAKQAAKQGLKTTLKAAARTAGQKALQVGAKALKGARDGAKNLGGRIKRLGAHGGDEGFIRLPGGKKAGAGADGLGDLASRRAKLGAPDAGPGVSPTLSRLDVDGMGSLYGVSGHGRDVTLRVNPISRSHAETDVLQQLSNLGGAKGTRGTMYIDYPGGLCGACGRSGAVKSMAGQVGLTELTIIWPGGKRVLRP